MRYDLGERFSNSPQIIKLHKLNRNLNDKLVYLNRCNKNIETE